MEFRSVYFVYPLPDLCRSTAICLYNIMLLRVIFNLYNFLFLSYFMKGAINSGGICLIFLFGCGVFIQTL